MVKVTILKKKGCNLPTMEVRQARWNKFKKLEDLEMFTKI